MGASTWLQTQRTHEPAVVGLKAAFPVHYELASGGMATAEQVGRGGKAERVHLSLHARPRPAAAFISQPSLPACLLSSPAAQNSIHRMENTCMN